MRQDKYPLIKRCFPELTVWSIGQHVLADELENELEKAVRVNGDNHGHWSEIAKRQIGDNGEDDTHTALLIGIEPIVKDTAESILRKFISLSDEVNLRSRIYVLDSAPESTFGLLIEDAKHLLRQLE